MEPKAHLSLLIGPVGAGKSTFAREKAARSRAAFLDLDAWMVRLYGEDPRPRENLIAWYLERRGRVRALLWDTTLEVLAGGSNVFLELGLVSQAEREAFYAQARDEDLNMTVYCLDAPRDVRRQRVSERNSSGGKYVQVVPTEFFERASDAWEAPTEAERSAVTMVDI